MSIEDEETKNINFNKNQYLVEIGSREAQAESWYSISGYVNKNQKVVHLTMVKRNNWTKEEDNHSL